MSLSMRVLATARVEAVAPEGGEALLHQFLKAYRNAIQYVVDGIWGLDDTVSQQMAVHRLSYSLISWLSTIYFSTASPSPLTAVTPT
jgi:hypothetical protein